MVKTVYIAGPITGDPKYKKKFQAAEDVLRRMGFIVANPVKMFGHLADQGMSDDYILRLCTEIIDHIDEFALLPGWRKSRGACEELRHYMTYNYPSGPVYEFVSYIHSICLKKNKAEDYEFVRSGNGAIEPEISDISQPTNEAQAADGDKPKRRRMFGTDSTECIGNEPIPRDIIGSLCAATSDERHQRPNLRLDFGIQEMLDKYGYVYKDYEGRLYYDGKVVCTIDGLIYGR